MKDNLAYQEETREELIDGKIVAMSPRPMFNHNRISFNIAHIFETYLKHEQCTAIADSTDLYLRACLKSFDKKGRVGDNRKKQAGAGENASIPK